MLNQYPLWKNLLVVFVLLIGTFLALPNIFGQDPAIDVSGNRNVVVDESLKTSLETALSDAKIGLKSVTMKDRHILLRFNSAAEQHKAQQVVANTLPENYIYALALKPNVPGWLMAFGVEPMNLGLDLRGGIHVLIDVDMDAAIKGKMETYTSDIRSQLRQAKIRYITVKPEDTGVNVKFRDAAAWVLRI